MAVEDRTLCKMTSCKLLVTSAFVVLVCTYVIENEVSASPSPCFFFGRGRRHKKEPEATTTPTPAPEEPKNDDTATKEFEKNFERLMDFFFGGK